MTIYNNQPVSSSQLESFDSMKANYLNTNQNRNTSRDDTNNNYSNDSSYKSSDSFNRKGYKTDPNMLIPMDQMNPILEGSSKEDTKDKNIVDFATGLVKGVGKAAMDTAKGLVTLGKVAVVGVTHPKQTLSFVGSGVQYAINHPLAASKTVLVDMPIALVKGIVNPYAEAVKSGHYGEAIGRGVFDVSLILLTAGSTSEGSASSGAGATTPVTTAPVAATTSPTTAAAEAVSNVDNVANYTKDVASVINQGTQGVADGLGKVATGGINVQGGIQGGINITINGQVKGNVIFQNIGNTSASIAAQPVTNAATKLAGTAGAAESVAGVAGQTASAAAESISLISGNGLIGQMWKQMGAGFNRISQALVGSNIGQSVSSGITTIFGPELAPAIKNTMAVIGQGLSKTGQVVKTGFVFAKQHPVISSMVAGRTVSVIEEGLKATDNYRENSNNNYRNNSDND